MKKESRYNVIDFIRGFALINMILYHGLWDAVYIFGADIPWYTSVGGYVWQQCICRTFILVSGFCRDIGKKKLKRGVVVFGCSLILTAVTAVFMPENIILFGVLSFLGTAMLILIPFDGLLKRMNPWLGLVAFWLVFELTFGVNAGYIGFGDIRLLNLPEAWYSNLFTAFLGFPPRSFSSADYFSLMPWLFLYLTGYFLYRVFCECDWMKALTPSVLEPLEWIGRKSLWIYMAHQPVIFGVLAVVFWFL